MDYSFIETKLDEMYGNDIQTSRSMIYLSLLALFISCLGIFGLMSYVLKEKTKEIGIRKVMGASFTGLAGLLTRDLINIIFIAAVTGGILGWYFSTGWLSNFAYRIRWGVDIVIASSVLTLLLAVIPISFNLIRSIRANPADSLRYE